MGGLPDVRGADDSPLQGRPATARTCDIREKIHPWCHIRPLCPVKIMRSTATTVMRGEG